MTGIGFGRRGARWGTRRVSHEQQVWSFQPDHCPAARRWGPQRNRQKFAPDLHTGTGNFTIPIAVPPGRNGFQPQLSLTYSTGNGNGPFGLGWSLSIPGISRKTSKGVPRYDGSPDLELADLFGNRLPTARFPIGVVRRRSALRHSSRNS